MTATATLLVRPAGHVSTGQLTFDKGSRTATLTLTLDSVAPAGGSVIHILCSRPDMVTVPQFVTVAQKMGSANVSITGRSGAWSSPRDGHGPLLIAYMDARLPLIFELSPAFVSLLMGCADYQAGTGTVTTGEQVTLSTNTQLPDSVNVLLRGFQPQGPTIKDINGDGFIQPSEIVSGPAQNIYCACQTVRVVSGNSDLMGGQYWQFSVTIPLDAPPGEYEITQLTGTETCPNQANCDRLRSHVRSGRLRDGPAPAHRLGDRADERVRPAGGAQFLEEHGPVRHPQPAHPENPVHGGRRIRA